MFYGYRTTDNDELLEKELKIFVATLPKDKLGKCCYVESFNGVRIRRLTHYDDEHVDWIIEQADRIYKKVNCLGRSGGKIKKKRLEVNRFWILKDLNNTYTYIHIWLQKQFQ